MTPIGSNPARDPADEPPARAWLRALEMTAAIERKPEMTLFRIIEEVAESRPDALALLSATECVSYGALVERCNRYARWATANGLGRGNTVCLLMPNRAEYMAAWLGITATGCSVALLNTRLVGQSLAHCLETVAPSHVIVAAEFLESLSALALSGMTVVILAYGSGCTGFRDIEDELNALPRGRPDNTEYCRVRGGPITIRDRALYIYTSGTTGLPKAVIISHGRIVQWSLWFAGLMGARADDRMYNCLPLYHSVGGIVATGPMLATGGSVVISQEFSASRFWSDIVSRDCTLFQYIGELCRYLLHAPADPRETAHRLRMCVGNGLRPEIWRDFKSRFNIPRILEFYAATEGTVSLFNVEGKTGSLGRIPPFLAHRFQVALLKYDAHGERPSRNPENLCVSAGPDEVGEAVVPITGHGTSAGTACEGYTTEDETERKIIRDVFEPGDAWFRTGDLMRRDARGYYYFVDRIGDTFRWKGENVAASEVERVICSFPGIRQVSVYGVAVPHADGRAGMAAVACVAELPREEFHAHLSRNLPDFAHPIFLRLCGQIETTGTFKNMKEQLSRAGYDPAATGDAIFFNDRKNGAFVPMNGTLFDQIQKGEIIL